MWPSWTLQAQAVTYVGLLILGSTWHAVSVVFLDRNDDGRVVVDFVHAPSIGKLFGHNLARASQTISHGKGYAACPVSPNIFPNKQVSLFAHSSSFRAYR